MSLVLNTSELKSPSILAFWYLYILQCIGYIIYIIIKIYNIYTNLLDLIKSAVWATRNILIANIKKQVVNWKTI